jgi:hypothetical protein
MGEECGSVPGAGDAVDAPLQPASFSHVLPYLLNGVERHVKDEPQQADGCDHDEIGHSVAPSLDWDQ